MNADELTCQALLNCLVREVSGPEQQTWRDDGRLVIRLARSGTLLRAELSGARPAGRAQVRAAGSWHAVQWQELTRLIAAELGHASGTANEEFAGQVGDSHAAMTAIIGMPRRAGPAGHRIDRYLASEQALVAGHRFHPAPKARPGAAAVWPDSPGCGRRCAAGCCST